MIIYKYKITGVKQSFAVIDYNTRSVNKMLTMCLRVTYFGASHFISGRLKRIDGVLKRAADLQTLPFRQKRKKQGCFLDMTRCREAVLFFLDKLGFGEWKGKGIFVEPVEMRELVEKEAAALNANPSEESSKRKQEYWLNWEELLKKQRLYLIVRRAQDIFFSLLALVVLAIPMLLMALVIWIDSPGASPIFSQDRVGRNGKIFKFYKFRSMVPNAETMLHEVLEQNEMDGPVFKIKSDPRITRVGRWIRRTSLDELPQLINVLQGNMSIVGPRPALPREVAKYTNYEKQRLYVTPGLTCYWQVQPNRNELTFDEWVELDLKYIQDRSFWLDWKLIALTIVAMFGMYGE